MHMPKRSSVKVIDLFAGAGGFSIGATSAGAEVVACVEIDKTACETLHANETYHGRILEGDICHISGESIRTLTGIRKSDPLVIVGGPPCQAFSKAAYWTESGDEAAYRRARARGEKKARPKINLSVTEDARRDLVFEFYRIILETNADGFIFENVPSIKHPKYKPIYESFLKKVKEAGYNTAEITAKAAAFGVPQTRERVIIIGARKRTPQLPVETHSTSENGDLLLPKAISAGEVLEEFQSKKYFEPEEVVVGRWANHLAEIPPGWNYKALTEWAGHKNPSFVAETRFWNFLLKLSPKRPSWTIAASPGPWTGPFHWENRRLRTPELAALQGFPRRYEIMGTRRERVRQMGNAIPVQLAKVMMESLLMAVE
jgi:DNA (cytosine-5)-methyltransferase 1